MRVLFAGGIAGSGDQGVTPECTPLVHSHPLPAHNSVHHFICGTFPPCTPSSFLPYTYQTWFVCVCVLCRRCRWFRSTLCVCAFSAVRVAGSGDQGVTLDPYQTWFVYIYIHIYMYTYIYIYIYVYIDIILVLLHGPRPPSRARRLPVLHVEKVFTYSWDAATRIRIPYSAW